MSTTNIVSIGGFVLSLVIAIGLIVLMALNVVTSADGLPILALLAGLHIGVGGTATIAAMTKNP